MRRSADETYQLSSFLVCASEWLHSLVIGTRWDASHGPDYPALLFVVPYVEKRPHSVAALELPSGEGPREGLPNGSAAITTAPEASPVLELAVGRLVPAGGRDHNVRRRCPLATMRWRERHFAHLDVNRTSRLASRDQRRTQAELWPDAVLLNGKQTPHGQVSLSMYKIQIPTGPVRAPLSLVRISCNPTAHPVGPYSVSPSIALICSPETSFSPRQPSPVPRSSPLRLPLTGPTCVDAVVDIDML